jgi:hypothetical protein
VGEVLLTRVQLEEPALVALSSWREASDVALESQAADVALSGPDDDGYPEAADAVPGAPVPSPSPVAFDPWGHVLGRNRAHVFGAM